MNHESVAHKFSLSCQKTHLQNWVEISCSALEHNAQQFQRWLGSTTKIIAMVKSNAYGHGLPEITQIYEACDAIAAFCTISLSQAVIIRQAGIQKPILVIGYLDLPYEKIIEHHIQVIIYDLHLAEQLNRIADALQTMIEVHIKIDTGMSRLGFTADELPTALAEIKKLSWLKIVGICSHLAQGYHPAKTEEQQTLFLKNITEQYPTHIANSHGSLILPQHHYNFARIGIGLYGYLARHDKTLQQQVKPVLSFKTKILQIKEITAGTQVGYDGLFTADKSMKIATIACGYYEGLDSRLAKSGKVIVNGQFASILGRICMNLTIIDISDITDVAIGSTVTLIGTDGDATISLYDWSKITDASVYNLLINISENVPKIIVP